MQESFSHSSDLCVSLFLIFSSFLYIATKYFIYSYIFANITIKNKYISEILNKIHIHRFMDK